MKFGPIERIPPSQEFIRRETARLKREHLWYTILIFILVSTISNNFNDIPFLTLKSLGLFSSGFLLVLILSVPIYIVRIKVAKKTDYDRNNFLAIVYGIFEIYYVTLISIFILQFIFN